ncbi:MAG: VOC family protein [Burkholderiaceae bacterium]|nr:VOC family protein [Burkholderiaceae bacterium]
MILGVNHIALSVPDLNKALAFYCDLLGFERGKLNSWEAGTTSSATAEKILAVSGTAADVMHVRGPNLLIELFQFRGGNPQLQDPARPVVDHGITHFCLSVSDLDKEYARLYAAGVKFHGPPTAIAPGLRTCYLRDPFGNVLELEEAKGRTRPAESALVTVERRMSNIVLGAVFALIFAACFLWRTPSLPALDSRWLAGSGLLAVYLLILWLRERKANAPASQRE